MPLTDTIGVNWAWVIPALSASAFFLVFPFRRQLPQQGAFISISAILLGFVLFWFVLADLLSEGEHSFSITWLRVGDTVLTWGVMVDRLSVVMLGLVTFVALLVQVYSLGYMTHGDKRDPGFGRYFAFHSMFSAAMLTLILADNLLFLYIAWELVGLGSYLLIGFWYERRSAAEAAKKAFVATRIGDVGLLIGIILLFKATGSFDISTIIHVAGQNGAISHTTLTVAALLLFLGAMGKSAQFPFHVWLPDAMEGPTPVSALIHAATMVAAGVYLVARMLPLFELTPTVMLVVASVGLFTFLFAGTLALVMTDIKRILAYSTVSHLGLMMLSLGAGAVGAAIFHLVAHGLSKALLFLGAGSVMHSMNNETDIWKMGGLRHSLPVTSWTFLIGAASLAGVIPLAGFFSKDEILLHVLDDHTPLFIILTLAGLVLSALYMARVALVVFLGPRKNDHSAIRESPLVMTIPLVLLAFLVTTVGFIAFGYGSGYDGFGSFIEKKGEFEIKLWLTVGSLSLVILGLTLGWATYQRGTISHHNLAKRYAWVYKVLANKYYIDEGFQWVIDRLVLVFGRLVGVFDRVVVNDSGVDGLAITIRLSALKLRLSQTGRFHNYGMGMALGVVALTLVWWLVQK